MDTCPACMDETVGAPMDVAASDPDTLEAPGNRRSLIEIISLLDSDDHRVRPDEVFDIAFAEADLGHPSATVRA